MQKYRVSEIYRAIQGEGWHSGMPCTLIRFQGCNLQCSFCDTPQAQDPEGGKEYNHDELCDLIKGLPCYGDIILLTGGEPTMQPLYYLARALRRIGPIHLETNGTFSLEQPLVFDWITLSPKPPAPVVASVAEVCHEIKWLVASEDDIDALKDWLADRRLADRKKICLQPISQDTKATEIAYDACLKYGWRLSLQLHRYIDRR